MGAHIIDGQFQSDKYPTCPPGKVPLSVKDPTAQDLLWMYAQRRREVDAEFSDDLETALRSAGYTPADMAENSRLRLGLGPDDEDVDTLARVMELKAKAGAYDRIVAALGRQPTPREPRGNYTAAPMNDPTEEANEPEFTAAWLAGHPKAAEEYREKVLTTKVDADLAPAVRTILDHFAAVKREDPEALAVEAELKRITSGEVPDPRTGDVAKAWTRMALAVENATHDNLFGELMELRDAWKALRTTCQGGDIPKFAPLSEGDSERTARRLCIEMGVNAQLHARRIQRVLHDVAEGGRGHVDGSKRATPLPLTDARPTPITGPPSSEQKCSFCRTPREAAKRLFASPTASICEACVDLCNDITAAEDGDLPEHWHKGHAPEATVHDLVLLAIRHLGDADLPPAAVEPKAYDKHAMAITACGSALDDAKCALEAIGREMVRLK